MTTPNNLLAGEAMTTQVTEADVIETCEVHGLPLDPEQLEVVTAVVNQIMLSASKPVAPAQSGDVETVFDWLETELTAISCWHLGDPSYDYDAHWMKDRVLKLIAYARKAFAAPIG